MPTTINPNSLTARFQPCPVRRTQKSAGDMLIISLLYNSACACRNMQITIAYVLRVTIITLALFFTFKLLENAPFGFVIRLILPLTITAVVVTIWKLCDHPFMASTLDLIQCTIKRLAQFRKHNGELKQFFRDVARKTGKAISDLRNAISNTVPRLLEQLRSCPCTRWKRYQNKDPPGQ
jgi:hypothetical protein